MRTSLIPAFVIALLLGLVFLMPKRDSGVGPSGAFLLPGSTAMGADVAGALQGLPRLELLDPPSWVKQRGGQDEVLRSLDRVSWGSHDSIRASIRALEAHGTGFAQEVLSRLDALPDHDIIHISKLVALLVHDGENTPGVVEELTRRALSPSGLVAKAALKALGEHRSQEALGAILERRRDEDLEVRDVARKALVSRVRRGDEEALAYMLEDMELQPHLPELRYIRALEDVEANGRVLSALRRIEELSSYSNSVTALGVLVSLGDAEATSQLESMMGSDDMATRINALHMAANSRQVVGQSHWRDLVEVGQRTPCLLLLAVLDLAINSGHEGAPEAVELIERMAQDPTHSSQVESLDLLFAMGHPWGVERTRAELQSASGPYLSQTVERIERAGGKLGAPFADLAFDRLSQPDLLPMDRLLLCRLLAGIDPLRGAELLVRLVSDATEGGSSLELINQLVKVGDPALQLLARSVDTDRGAGLFVFVASQIGGAGAVPLLEQIAANEGLDPVVRQHALDSLVRVVGGDRAGALRRVATASNDERVRQRSYLLFWNYL